MVLYHEKIEMINNVLSGNFTVHNVESVTIGDEKFTIKVSPHDTHEGLVIGDVYLVREDETDIFAKIIDKEFVQTLFYLIRLRKQSID